MLIKSVMSSTFACALFRTHASGPINITGSGANKLSNNETRFVIVNLSRVWSCLAPVFYTRNKPRDFNSDRVRLHR